MKTSRRKFMMNSAVLGVAGYTSLDGTPVLDLKPYTPADAPSQTLKVPDWARRGPGNTNK